MIKEAATILLASVLSLTCMHSNAVEPEVSTLTCKDTKTAPPHVSRWKAVQPAVQEVTVNCGAQTVVMSPMPATSDKGSVEENAQQMW